MVELGGGVEEGQYEEWLELEVEKERRRSN